jgi:hypothetical protein
MTNPTRAPVIVATIATPNNPSSQPTTHPTGPVAKLEPRPSAVAPAQ